MSTGFNSSAPTAMNSVIRSDVNCSSAAARTGDATSSSDGADAFTTARFATGLLIYPIVCVVGLTGNTLALVVLSRPKMKTSYNVFLAAMAGNDVIKLANDLLYFFDVVLLNVNSAAAESLFVAAYPVSHYIFNQTVCVGAWLTVSVAVERYIFVCHATRARFLCTVRRSVVVSVFIYVSMSLLTLPSALRYQRAACRDPLTNSTVDGVDLTPLGRREPFATVYYQWTLSLLRSIVPLFVLVVLNSYIIRSLQTRQAPGQHQSRPSPSTIAANRASPRRRSASKNRSATVTLVVVVVVFVVCIVPDAVMSVVFGIGYVDERNSRARAAREVTDALLALSSAVNFVVYCLCSRQFRAVLNDVVSRRRESEVSARTVPTDDAVQRRASRPLVMVVRSRDEELSG